VVRRIRGHGINTSLGVAYHGRVGEGRTPPSQRLDDLHGRMAHCVLIVLKRVVGRDELFGMKVGDEIERQSEGGARSVGELFDAIGIGTNQGNLALPERARSTRTAPGMPTRTIRPPGRTTESASAIEEAEPTQSKTRSAPPLRREMLPVEVDMAREVVARRTALESSFGATI